MFPRCFLPGHIFARADLGSLTTTNPGQNPAKKGLMPPTTYLVHVPVPSLDIQSYLLRFGILGIFWAILGVQIPSQQVEMDV